jgi:hypothetical protein
MVYLILINTEHTDHRAINHDLVLWLLILKHYMNEFFLKKYN